MRDPSPQSRLDIRLESMADKYGSPSLDDIERFSRELSQRLSALLGEEAAGSLEVEVSSPGAEREVEVPRDLERFR